MRIELSARPNHKVVVGPYVSVAVVGDEVSVALDQAGTRRHFAHRGPDGIWQVDAWVELGAEAYSVGRRWDRLIGVD